ncbi:hypothetical protein EON71_00105 [bacterium]|nr:MAG: hypothetical protein EON71_00105 [bacterium]
MTTQLANNDAPKKIPKNNNNKHPVKTSSKLKEEWVNKINHFDKIFNDFINVQYTNPDIESTEEPLKEVGFDDTIIDTVKTYMVTKKNVWYRDANEENMINYLRNEKLQVAIPFFEPCNHSPILYVRLIYELNKIIGTTKNIKIYRVNENWFVYYNVVNEEWVKNILNTNSYLFHKITTWDNVWKDNNERISSSIIDLHHLYLKLGNNISDTYNACHYLYTVYNNNHIFTNMTEEDYYNALNDISSVDKLTYIDYTLNPLLYAEIKRPQQKGSHKRSPYNFIDNGQLLSNGNKCPVPPKLSFKK